MSLILNVILLRDVFINIRWILIHTFIYIYIIHRNVATYIYNSTAVMPIAVGRYNIFQQSSTLCKATSF